jgi:hypothetical protein
MPADEIFRPSRREDVPELNRLFAEVFGAERSASIWSWKYFDNPRGTHSFVCEVDGRVVAHCGGTPIVMNDGPRRYLALQSVDFMSTRNHAGGLGRGSVFYRLVQGFFEAYCGPGRAEMVYGFPGERHRMVGEKLLGYRPVEAVGELTLEPETTAGSLDVEPIDSYLALLSQASPLFGGVRDTTYVDWRYRRHPEHRYGAIGVKRWPWRSAQLAAVVRETADEWLIMELEGEYSERLLNAMVGRLRRGGKKVRLWGSAHHPRSVALLRAGFSAAERPHRLETRFFFERAIPSPGELYYSLGDYDVF